MVVHSGGGGSGGNRTVVQYHDVIKTLVERIRKEKLSLPIGGGSDGWTRRHGGDVCRTCCGSYYSCSSSVVAGGE